jgi:hypothetical protein
VQNRGGVLMRKNRSENLSCTVCVRFTEHEKAQLLEESKRIKTTVGETIRRKIEKRKSHKMQSNTVVAALSELATFMKENKEKMTGENKLIMIDALDKMSYIFDLVANESCNKK